MTNNRVLLIKRLCIALEVLPTTQEKKAENLHSQVVKPHFSRCGKSSPKCFHFETSGDFLGHLAVKKCYILEKKVGMRLFLGSFSTTVGDSRMRRGACATFDL